VQKQPYDAAAAAADGA